MFESEITFFFRYVDDIARVVLHNLIEFLEMFNTSYLMLHLL